MEEKAQKIAQLLKLLANEHRLLILCALMQSPLNVGEIHKFTPNISASALSQHLSKLQAAGILSCEKSGMNVSYQIVNESTRKLIVFIKSTYCDYY